MPTLISGSTGVNKITDGTVVNADMADDAIGVAELSASGTASSSTFLRGDNSWAEAGGGKVLQVVQGTNGSTFSTTSSTYGDTGLSATITPSATSSKILCIVSEVGFVHGGGSSLQAFSNLVRGSTEIIGAHSQGDGDSDMHYLATSLVYLDSPSTTSATTYKTQMRTTSGTVYLNWHDTATHKSTLTLVEIGA